MPRVSVVIPTFNCASYVTQAVDSVLSQTYRDYEIIVVDDGSIDGTAERLGDYGRKLRYFYQENQGVSAARNQALEIATGQFIAYLDSDDLWHPEKLERQVSFLDTHMKCGLVHSEISVINKDNEIIHVRFNSETARPVPQGSCLLELLQRSHIQTLTVVERRECIEKVGGFDKRLPVAQDYMHWIKISLEGWAFGYIAEPLGTYRWRSGSLMANKKRLLEDYELIYSTLLNDMSLSQRFGQRATQIASERMNSIQRDLACLDFTEGRNAAARRRLASLIHQSPMQPGLYVDLLKACLHPSLYATLRALRR